MGFKEYLVSKGLDEAQADAIIAGMSENKLYLSEHERIDERYQAQKTKYEQLETDLATANKLVDDLKKSNKDNEALQTEVADYKSRVKQLESERALEQATWDAKELLKDAIDPEYALYKLGELALDANGKVADLENRVKSLKENEPHIFKDKEDVQAPGYTVEANGIKTAVDAQTYDFSKMTEQEINDNWDSIVASQK